MADRHFDDLDELPVLLVLEADIAGIDPVLGQRLGTGGVIGQQGVADIVKISDQRHVEAEAFEPFTDLRHGCGTFVAVDGDPDNLRAGFVKGCDLGHGGVDVGGVGVGHRLHHDGRTAADNDASDIDSDAGTTGLRGNKGGHGHRGLGLLSAIRREPSGWPLPKTPTGELEAV